MDLISVVIVLIVVGVVLYLITTYIPLDPPIRIVIQVLVILALCLWLLRMFVGPGVRLFGSA